MHTNQIGPLWSRSETISEGTSAENHAVSLLKDGKLRKLYADSNSNLTVVASPDKAQTTISLKRPFNPVSITSNADSIDRTLEHVKKGHINVFAIANNNVVTNNVELNVDPTPTRNWVDLETLDVLNRTGRDMTIKGTVLSADPPGSTTTPKTITLHAGCALQLQYIGENRCAVVATAQQVTTDTVSGNNEATLIEETSNGTTKLRRVKGEGTVQVNSTNCVITIKGSGDIAQVSGAKQGAVSLLTGGSGDGVGKLRKLLADEYSGMTITSSGKEASLSIHKPINVIDVTQQLFAFTLANVKKNQLNIFRVGSQQPPSAVELDITETLTVTWNDLRALELYNDTLVDVTIKCNSNTSILSSDLTMPPGHTLQLQYLTLNTHQSNRPTVVAVSTISEGTSCRKPCCLPAQGW